MIYNPEQEAVIQGGVYHVLYSDEQVYQYAGGPGTGKTEIIHEIIRRTGINPARVAPMAFIGQAAIVLRLRGLYNAKTIHSWLYEVVEEPVLDQDGNPVMDPVYNKPMKKRKFVPKDLDDIDLFIIDEAGTVPMWMKNDIESRGKKIIACGDLDQLPPVGDQPAYLTTGKVHYLRQKMRQARGSYIHDVADMVLHGIEPPLGLHGNVLVIEQSDLNEMMIRNSQVIICGTNKTRDYFNEYIRRDMLGRTSNLPGYGERVMCRKNNWNIEVDGINLTNGLTGTVTCPPDVYSFDGKTFYMDFVSDLLSVEFEGVECNYQYFTEKDRKQKDLIKSSKYSQGNMFEFAYAKTVHLCQGSQYYNGIYISEWMNRDIQTRLDFTAVTRFINQMIYVVKKRTKYF